VHVEPQRENIRDIMASTSFFNGWIDEAQNVALMRHVSLDELLKVLNSFKEGNPQDRMVELLIFS